MSKFETLDFLLQKNNGFIKVSEAMQAGISRVYFGKYAQQRGLERVARGVYMSNEAWEDGMYVVQVRYPNAVFSHETALYLLGLAEREPVQYTVTLRAGASSARLAKQGIKVYKVKDDLFEEGLDEAQSPSGHNLRIYSSERTICDLFRSRRNVEIQDLQAAIKAYVHQEAKNIPLLMRYAAAFSVEKIVQQYLEVLLP